MSAELSEKSKEAYKNMLSLMSNKIPNFNILQTTKNIEYITNMKKANKTEYTDDYKKNLLNALIHYTKDESPTAYKDYVEKRDHYATVTQFRQESQTLTEIQKKNVITWEEVLTIKQSLPKDSEDYVLLSLYTTEGMPPIRADYSPMRVFGSVKDAKQYEGNYMTITARTCTLVLREYKTAKSNGPIIHNLPGELCRTLRKWHNPSNQWLFQYPNGEPWKEEYLSSRVTAIFKRVIGKNVGITMLRIAHNTAKGEGERSILEKKKMAHIMGHSILTGEKYSKKD